MTYFFVTDSSADPLLDEHFRRSLGDQKYRSLFKKSEEPAPASPPARSVSSMSPTSSASSSTKVSPKSAGDPDPVKAFHDDMDTEGYTGAHFHDFFKEFEKKNPFFNFSRRSLCQGTGRHMGQASSQGRGGSQG